MNEDLPPLASLRAFEAVGRHGSVSAAARELGVSHAAVSQQVKALETWLGGVRLLRRAGRSVALTAEGARYHASLGEAWRLIEGATAALRRDERDRPLEVTTTSSFLARWLMPRLSRFQLAHPGVQLRLNPSRDLVDFDRGAVDIAIRYGLGRWPGLKAEKLVGGRLTPVCAPSLLSKRLIRSPGDLADHVLLHDTDTSEWALWLSENGAEHVDVGLGPIHSGSAFVLDAAVQGLGVALGPIDILRDDVAAGRLVAPLDRFGNRDCAYHVVIAEGRPERAAARAFRLWLREEAALSVREGMNSGLAAPT